MAFAALLVLALLPSLPALAADQFTKPTPEELKMTELPGYPGAAAIVLFREEITTDDLHSVQHYDRIKVLTEEGKKYANVELPYFSTTGTFDERGDDKTVESIVGRTIHPDGTVIPFTGKPYLKTMVKGDRLKYQAKIFTLPDVEVGSILEYRYATRYSDYAYEAPDWYIQGDLFLKNAHYVWYPTRHELQDSKGIINTISWFPILPLGARIERTEMPGVGNGDSRPQQVYTLHIKDVPPKVHEEFMPPIASYSYRVLFNFSSYRSADEYWRSEGKSWARRADAFAKASPPVSAAAQAAVAGAGTPEEKLHKIYAAVMELENTGFTRERDGREDKAEGVGKLTDASEVLGLKRGTPTQLTGLFVAIARAAGFKADLMLVPDRSEQLFTPLWLNFRQLEDEIAIVHVEDKEVFFDPGSRYCAYGHLAWEHTFIQGLREKDGATAFEKTPGDSYKENSTARVANLNMDAEGQLTGKIDLTFSGASALRWRQNALRNDEESLRHDLRVLLEERVPRSMEVRVTEVENLKAYEKPLVVRYQVKGTMGTVTGKRLVMPADLFLAAATAQFSHEKRELAVYFHYPELVQDALRINLPSGFSVEAVPSSAKYDMPKSGTYNMSVTSTPNSFTTRRQFAFGDIFVLPPSYPALRGFYSEFQTNDQQSVVLKQVPTVTASAASE